MNFMEACKAEADEIYKKEPELLVQYIAEMHEYNTICGRRICAADKTPHAIMHITSVYAQAIKKARGGWTCGTHTINVRTALSHTIAAKYTEEHINCFIYSYVSSNESQKSLRNADNDIRAMEEDYLSMRPTPLVHPPASWWIDMLEDEDKNRR